LELITVTTELPLSMLLEILTGVTWGKSKGANDLPNIFLNLRIILAIELMNLDDSGGKGCMCIKHWLTPIFPVFLTLLLRKFPNTHGRFGPPPQHSVINQVMPMEILYQK
jgi:hypothetical protein